MKSFLNLPTQTKLFLGFGLMFVFLAAVIATAYAGMKVVQGSYIIALQLTTLENNLNRQQAAITTMLVVSGGQAVDQLVADINTTTDENSAIMQVLDQFGQKNPAFRDEIRKLIVLREQYKDVRDRQVIPAIRAAEMEKARGLIFDEQHQRYEQMRDSITRLRDGATKQAEDRASQGATISLVVGAIALVLSLLMATSLSQIIAKPLREISNAAERIAVGDLNARVDCDSRRDEVGVLASTFTRMTQSLQGMAGVAGQIAEGDLRVQVKPQSERDTLGTSFASMVANLQRMTTDLTEAANVLGSASSEIVASTTQLASSSTQTATAVSETTTTIEEVRQTAQLSSQKAKYVSDSAQKVAQTAQTGKQATEDTNAVMQRIRTQMDSIGDSMGRLTEQTQAIGAIIATVDDLAQRSNLLAVNASIEAAKAGEQGKGFAVVAQEVKTLAEQSKQATTQVRTILSDIQKATSAAVMATEQGSKAVEAGVQQATEAGESIVSLSDSIGAAAQAATQIAASNQQQLVGMDQVVVAMESVKQASMQNVDSARQLEEAARNLNELGQRLKQLVEQYQA
ncbi:MAG: methyl-accepting chemotaxis protein [Armatimonadota bacterium]|nr:methyl-accepting chemotaxis protein [Armatimonadota bacterium]